ncbi:hypothetical protein MLGJGCBP_04621 [Rhodococcus sp. T7]|nr:hypothetical protein MLGJGCBP_04621 [Rhodococcus sp. T7]
MIAISTAAMSSMNTPALLIIAMRRTPSALTTVVKPIITVPRMTALVAKSCSPVPSPTIWKPLHSRGRLSCSASTTADRVTIDAVSISQPADHPTTRLPSVFAQLYTEPAIGYLAASSMKQSATESWPRNTSGHDHR